MSIAMSYETVRSVVGYDFRVRSNVSSAAFVLDRLFAPFNQVCAKPGIPTYVLTEEEAGERRFVLTRDGSMIQRVDAAGSMFNWMMVDITRRAVEQSEGYVAIHAGVVSWQGVAIVLPGAPDAGKTTTVAGLTRAGFDYLSEEVALLDRETGLVHPFPRPLVLGHDSLAALDGIDRELPAEYEDFRWRLNHVAPNDLRADAVGTTCPVGYVIAPRYREGAATALSSLSKAETLFLLAENSLNPEGIGSLGFAMLGRIAERASGYRLEVGDLPTAVEAVRGLVEGRRT